MIVVDREARMLQAICHAVQRLMLLNPLAVIHGPFPCSSDAGRLIVIGEYLDLFGILTRFCFVEIT